MLHLGTEIYYVHTHNTVPYFYYTILIIIIRVSRYFYVSYICSRPQCHKLLNLSPCRRHPKEQTAIW